MPDNPYKPPTTLGEPPRSDTFTVLDIIGTAIAISINVGLLIVPPLTVSVFAKMFADFGTALPWVTRAALTPWLVPLLTAIPASMIGLGLGPVSRISARRSLVGAAGIFGLVLGALWLMAMYVPVFSLAGNIE